MSNWNRPPDKAKEKIIVPEFVFDINGAAVIAKGSQISGKEEIFVDDQLVSEKRTYKRDSIHEFEVNGEAYKIRFYVKNPLGNKIRCYLLHNDQVIKKYLFDKKLNYPLFIEALILIVILFGSMGYIKAEYNLPDSIDIYVSIMGYIIPILATLYILSKGHGKIIEE